MSEPPIPANVDLNGFVFMPLDVQKVIKSRLATTRNAEAFRAAVLLWCHAWHEVPAGSLPDDDERLCALAGFGRDTKAWRRVRDEALHLFQRADDGRLYHPIIVGKALEAWDARVEFREDKASTKERKARERQDRGLMFAALRSRGLVLHYTTTTTQLREHLDSHGLMLIRDESQAGHAQVTAKRESGTGNGTETPQLLGSSSDGASGNNDSSERDESRPLALMNFEEREEACAAALRKAGVAVEAGDRRLRDAVHAGVGPKMLIALAVEKRGKGLPYLLTTAVNRIREGADRPEYVAPAPPKPPIKKDPPKPASAAAVAQAVKAVSELIRVKPPQQGVSNGATTVSQCPDTPSHGEPGQNQG